MSDIAFYFTISIFPIAVVLVFAMKYASAGFQARARLANDEDHQALVETSLNALAANDAKLAALSRELAAVSEKITAIHKILKDV